MTSSRIAGFHSLSRAERLAQLVALGLLSEAEARALGQEAGPLAELAESLSENVIGAVAVPLGVATNLPVDRADVLVAVATEESSGIAAVSNGARACRALGGLVTEADDPCMIAQVQITGLAELATAKAAVEARAEEIAELCNACDPMLVRLGGGFRGLEVRICGPFLVVHLIIDVRDAMGANAVNTMAEALAPKLEGWSGGKVGLRILSNLADRRLVRARAVWRAEEIGAERVRGIVSAYEFAAHDPYRAATHNKGIMNGISAVALATGNDTRALEAGAHAFAATKGQAGGYGPLSRYGVTAEGDLWGEIELPMAVGIVGGATRAHPTAQKALKIMQITRADRLARVMAAVGLVQNFSALRALAGEGIQRGHMGLHARNLAIVAGAKGAEIERIARRMIERGQIREDVARALLAES
ncbi:MAG: hydroxymethylglutaryl-CoA reductase, degradative [Roseobacter sp.]|nr:hydroxymethylglutaryl-CoA reductase, degradative [Roseobacter sp.]